MIFRLLASSLLVLSAAPLQAQIYADITVRQGETELGVMRAELEYERAPRAVANFIGLATGEKDWIDPRTNEIQRGVPFYDGIIFHRLDHDFVIQGGDPTGTGSGGPGYVWQDDFHPDLRHTGRYKLSMAHAGVNTNGSQFFITLEAAPVLDFRHSVFGEIIDHPDAPNGLAIVDSFSDVTAFPAPEGERPQTPITIESVEIIREPDDLNAQSFDASSPIHQLPFIEQIVPEIEVDLNSEPTLLELKWFSSSVSESFIDVAPTLNGSWFPSIQFLKVSPLETSMSTGTIPGVPRGKFFSRLREVNYSHSYYNAPSDLLRANGKLLLQRTSNVERDLNLELDFDGEGGGSYITMTGESGQITEVLWTDAAPTAFNANIFQPDPLNRPNRLGPRSITFVPRGRISFRVEPPIDERTNFSVDLNFMGANEGRFDSGDNPRGAGYYEGIFTYTPPPVED